MLDMETGEVAKNTLMRRDKIYNRRESAHRTNDHWILAVIRKATLHSQLRDGMLYKSFYYLEKSLAREVSALNSSLFSPILL